MVNKWHIGSMMMMLGHGDTILILFLINFIGSLAPLCGPLNFGTFDLQYLANAVNIE